MSRRTTSVADRIFTFICFLAAASSLLRAAEPLFPNPDFQVGSEPRAVEVADLNGDGWQDIVVANLISRTLTTMLGRGDGSFEPPRTTRLWHVAPDVMAIADLGNDGWPDVALDSGNAVQFWRGHGNGYFGFGPSVLLNDNPNDLVMGDLNGDGRDDLAAVTSQSKQLSIALFREGLPMFVSERYDAGADARSVAQADLDRNGTADLIVYGRCAGGDPGCPIGGLFVFLGQGDGTFSALPATPVSDWLGTIISADMDDDGTPDVVVSTQYGDVILYPGLGDGTFDAPIDLDAGEDPKDLAAADFNGDGITDLVVANSHADSSLPFNSGEISVLLGEGGGWFPNREALPAGGRPWALALGDFDDDADTDLVITKRQSGDGEAMVYLGRGDGSFAIRESAGPGGQQGSVLAVDLDGDALDEIASLRGNLDLFHKGSDGDYEQLASYDVGTFPVDLVSGHFDGDEFPDVAVINQGAVINNGSEDIAILLGLGDGYLAPAPVLSGVPWMTSVLADDYNGDGFDDLVVTSTGGSSGPSPDDLFLFLSRGDGSFAAAVTIPALTADAYEAAGGDFNRDGHRDFAVGGSRSYSVQVFLGGGDGTFSAQLPISARSGVFSIAAGDFDADEIEDLAISTGEVLFGVGDGSFAVLRTIDQNDQLLVEDLNLDGYDDIAARTSFFSAANLTIWLAGAGRTFAEPATHWGGAFPKNMGAGHLDGDRRIDLIIGRAHDDQQKTWILHNEGPLPDHDGDGDDNRDDPCTDGDDDGYGDPQFAANSCPPDNCPGAANPDQLDRDDDGVGDACDRCTDSDHDGAGDPGFDTNYCRIDNCPDLANGNQADADLDGLGDLCDPCTDPDGDGYGNPGIPGTLCDEDNCPAVANPLQFDSDADGDGDACDVCPLDPLDDWDRDGLCADVDNCDMIRNADQLDTDQDDHGDICDNCPDAANPDQSDSNDDGDGDACQPSLEILAITEDGGDLLEVTIALDDPQDDLLDGSVEIVETKNLPTVLFDIAWTLHCSEGFFPTGTWGEGFAFKSYTGQAPRPYLMDFQVASSQFGLGCGDGIADFEFGWGRCDDPSTTPYSSSLWLLGTTYPASVCAFELGASDRRIDITLLAADSFLTLESEVVSERIIPFIETPPRSIDISNLTIGAEQQIAISVTDGNTQPVAVESPFVYQGESTLVFNQLPQAKVIVEPTHECDRPQGALVILDGSSSSDADSSPGTSDDLVSFIWYEDLGLQSEQMLGSGPVLPVTLPLGAHRIALRVTDLLGEISTDETIVTVRDTGFPTIALFTDPTQLWPPNHRMVPIGVEWQVSDMCDLNPTVQLIAVSSNEHDDLPGPGDGNTVGDISGADISTADHTIALRAERSGSGAGRIYELLYRATDSSGNQMPAFAIITVPHARGNGSEPIILRHSLLPPGDGTVIYWSGMAEASGYDLIAADTGSLSPVQDMLSLGAVNVLARDATSTSVLVEDGLPSIPVGKALWFLIQPRVKGAGLGYGTASAPLPRVPLSCAGGCP